MSKKLWIWIPAAVFLLAGGAILAFGPGIRAAWEVSRLDREAHAGDRKAIDARARRLAEMGPGAFPALWRLARRADGPARDAAFEAILRMGLAGEDLVFASGEPGLRAEYACWLLARLLDPARPRPAWPEKVCFLAGSEVTEKDCRTPGHGRHHILDAAALEPLGRIASHEDPEVASEAINALCAFKSRAHAAVPGLCRALFHKDPGVRRFAASTLSWVRASRNEAGPDLARAALDPGTGRAAVSVLASLAPDLVPGEAKRAFLKDPGDGQPNGAEHAARWIREGGDVVRCSRRLAAWLGKPPPDSEAGEFAADVLCHLGRDARESIPLLLDSLPRLAPSSRVPAFKALVSMGAKGDEVGRKIGSLLRGPWIYQGWLNAQALADGLPSDRETVGAILDAAEAEPDPRIQQEVLKTVALLGPPADLVVPRLSAMFDRWWSSFPKGNAKEIKASFKMLEEGAEFLGRYGPRAVQAVPVLKRLAMGDFPDWEIRLSAAVALFRIGEGTASADAAFRAALESPDGRAAALASIRDCGPAARGLESVTRGIARNAAKPFRVEAARALLAMDPKDPEAQEILVTTVQDDSADAGTRLAILETLVDNGWSSGEAGMVVADLSAKQELPVWPKDMLSRRGREWGPKGILRKLTGQLRERDAVFFDFSIGVAPGNSGTSDDSYVMASSPRQVTLDTFEIIGLEWPEAVPVLLKLLRDTGEDFRLRAGDRGFGASHLGGRIRTRPASILSRPF